MLELEEELILLELLDVELELDDEVTLEFDEELMGACRGARNG